MSRKLASIQKISELRPIEGADKIEVASLEGLGWSVVVKKNEFAVGDLVIYCECDSILPDNNPAFEFLRERKFRIRICKFRKQISEGIIFPLSILPPKYMPTILPDRYPIDTDVTTTLGIVKYDPQLIEENSLKTPTKKTSIFVRFMMQFRLFRFFYGKLNHTSKGWPGWIEHTDETRCQNSSKLIISNSGKRFYITEKLDGASGTFYVYKNKHWGFPKFVFGVCSRNIKVGKGTNIYWEAAIKYDLEKKLLALKKDRFVIQGECVGGKTQGNKYKLTEKNFYVFNIIDNGVKYTLDKMIDFCNTNGLLHVPIVNDNFIMNCDNKQMGDIMNELVNMSNGKSQLNPEILREGLVVRLWENPDVSYKIISPEFLLKYNE